jgi:hypothetical protein
LYLIGYSKSSIFLNSQLNGGYYTTKNSVLAVDSKGNIQFDGKAINDSELVGIFKAKASPNFQV